MLLWLWRRSVATALNGPLAWEPPHALGVALKNKKKTKQKKKNLGWETDRKKKKKKEKRKGNRKAKRKKFTKGIC